MNRGLASGLGLAISLGAVPGARAAEVPFPAALDGAAVLQSNIQELDRAGLVLGNGDLTGLLWERDSAACIRVTKNDLWDARIDTSEDPPLLKVDVPNQKWTGGERPPSYGRPYPQPRCAGVVVVGKPVKPDWRCIRNEGLTSEWRAHGDVGTMMVEGKGQVSAGYRYELPAAAQAEYSAIRFYIQGTSEAQVYVNVFDAAGKAVVESGWHNSPPVDKEVSYPIPAGKTVAAIEVFIQAKNGSRVENRIHHLALLGQDKPLAIPLGMPAPTISLAKLDLRRAKAELRGRGSPPVDVRALADRNVFLITTTADVSLEAIPAAELPAPEQGVTDEVKWLYAKLPGDPDYPGMEYALAVASAGDCKAVALVTSHDTTQPVRDEAVRLARATAAEKIAELIAKHEQVWADYWAASGVELAGTKINTKPAAQARDFQMWWYRMVYFNRCFAKAGVVPAGLWSVLPNDAPPWHSDYHHNYNAWQPYWAPLILNHPELSDPWVGYMNALLPRMQWLAKTIYDCEGAYVGIASFPFEPDPANCKSVNQRQIFIAPYGCTLGMVGMSAQVLWMNHLYRPDRKYLEERIYPVVREVALFYASFVEKCPHAADGKAKFGPSYSPEHGKFGVADVPFDIAYAQYTLKAAITAAGELNRDAELAARFGKALELLPDYPTAPGPGNKPVVVDWAGCKYGEIPQHNITVPAVPVFPAEQVTWFSPQAEKDLFTNTIRYTRHRGCNSTVMMSVAKARLSMPDALIEAHAYYRPLVLPNGMFYWPMHGFYLTESVGIAAMVSEYLLQSVDNTIRVFPCWPKEQDARFAGLRAQGGFLVSAEQREGRVARVEITSTVGGKLRLLSPWTGEIIERATQAGEKVVLTP